MTLRLPVTLVDGRWEFLYGGAVPAIDGSVGELRIPESAILDAEFIATITRKRRAKILEAETPLCVAVKPARGLPQNLTALLLSSDTIAHDRSAKISPESRFVTVLLGPPSPPQQRRKEATGGLWLLLEGMQPVGLESSTIQLPQQVRQGANARSLNHALTILSEAFETDRISHTGNIYEHVLYKDSDGLWHPLKDLRDRELANTEREILRHLWAGVMDMMKTGR